MIVRFYESLGGKARGAIRSSLPVKRVWKCNVLEDDEEELQIQKTSRFSFVDVELRAFEIATYRLQL